MLIPPVAATPFLGIFYMFTLVCGFLFLSCWSSIPCVCNRVGSLLGLLLPHEPGASWYSGGSKNFTAVTHRKPNSGRGHSQH